MKRCFTKNTFKSSLTTCNGLHEKKKFTHLYSALILHTVLSNYRHTMKHQGQFGIHIDKLGVKRLVVLLTIPIMPSWHHGNLVYTCEPLALTEKQHLKGVRVATIPQFNSTPQSFI